MCRIIIDVWNSRQCVDSRPSIERHIGRVRMVGIKHQWGIVKVKYEIVRIMYGV